MEEKKQRGRPTKFTPEVIEQFLRAFEETANEKTAAQMAGISRACVIKWRRKAKTEEEFQQFAKDYAKVLCKLEAQAVAKIKQSTDWRSAAWFLERRFPEKWASVDRKHVEEIQERRKKNPFGLRRHLSIGEGE